MSASQRPSGMRTGGQRLVDFLLILVTVAPILVALLFLSAWLSRQFCPAEPFMAGPLSDFGRLAATVAAAFALGYLMLRGLFLLVPRLVRYAGYPSAYRRKPVPGSWSATWLKFAALTAVIALPCLVANAASEFCLSPSGIAYRSAPWDESRRFRWDDVVAVQTWCRRGTRGRWPAGYVLILRDGTSIDVMTAAPQLTTGFPRLVRALSGRHVAFDSSRVAADCGNAYAGALRTPLP